jgi:DNA-binding transcriptional regulator YiaG
LGITHRRIQVSRRHISIDRNPKKSIPVIVKTLGDQIQIKRYEKGLLQSQVAKALNVMTSLVKSWEDNSEKPTQAQWFGLANLLGLPDGLYSHFLTAE